MKTKLKGKILAILMALAMAFTMMPMIGGAVYADDTDLYTVTILPGEGTGDPLTIQWKDVEPDPTIEYSTPESINVNYGDARTAFDVQVTGASFTQGKTNCGIRLYDSAFTCRENSGSIPFTMNGNGTSIMDARFPSGGGIGYRFYTYSTTTLPYTVQAYILISSDDFEAAEPGNYTATLEIDDEFGGARYIPLTLTVPDKSIEHTVTVTNNGNGTASADPQSGTWGTEVTLTATPNPGCVFKEWQVISGGVTVSNDKFTIGMDDVEIKAIFVKPVDVPEGKTLTYNGEEQSGVEAGEGYELINASATNADSYEATATLKDGYVWADEGTTDPKTIPWKINKAIAEDKVAIPTGDTLTYNGKAQTGVAAGERYTLTDASATNAGDYTAKATLKTDPNYIYEWTDGSTGMQEIPWKINKAANPLTIKAKTATVKGSTKGKNGKLKKTKTLAVSKVIAFTKKGQGKMTYTKSSGSKKITINKTTGKVTVKKGLKKGTYKVKVKVKAAGNANYKASAVKTVTFKVKVK